MRMIDANTLKAEFTGNFQSEYSTAEIHALIDLAPTVGGWISVKDRLPEEGQTVIALLYYSRSLIEFESAQYTNKHFSTEECYIPDHLVTHWLTIPEPPEELKHEL